MNVFEQITNEYVFDGDNALIGKTFRKYISISLIELIIKEIENEETI